MITPNTKNRLPSAYLPYRITVALIGFVLLFVVLAGFFMLWSSMSSVPGAVVTQTINGVQQQVPATPFAAGPAIGITALVLIVLAIVGILYQVLYYATCSFIVADGQITVTSGVLFTSDKSTQFEEVQTVAVKRGPVMRMFGLGNLQGFTSSPDQIQIHTGNKGGSYTSYHPDINLVLIADDAEALRAQISSAIHKVQFVAPAAAA